MGQDQDPQDTEGHKHLPDPATPDDDAEGHYHKKVADDDTDTDTEGHKHLPTPSISVTDDDSDVEGHKHNRGA